MAPSLTKQRKIHGFATVAQHLAQQAPPFLRRHWDILILCCATCCALIYYVWDINSWKFAFVGDEWPFYKAARAIANHNLLVNPFDMRGVYGFNGVLGSFYQAIFIKLLGANNLAWRLSSILLVIPISVFFYLWMREYFDKPTALLSTLILQASAYVANYLKIGYVNAQAFALFIVALYLASRCGRRPSPRNAAALGIILGLSFYIYIGPLFPLFVLPYLLPLLVKKRYSRKQLLQFGAICLAFYATLILPGLISLISGGTTLNKTSFAREYHDNTQIVINIVHDFLLFYQNHDYFYNHFIAGPYLDLYSRILATFGIMLTLIRFRKANYLFLLLTYILVAVIIGATSPYAYTATTRGIFFIPFGAAFAGIALATLTKWFRIGLAKLATWLWEFSFHEARGVHMLPALAYAPLLLAVLSIWLVNVYQSQIGVFQQTGYPATGLIIKAMQEAQQRHQQHVELVISSQEPFHTYETEYYTQLPVLQEAYGLQNVHILAIDPSRTQCAVVARTDVLYFQSDGGAISALSRLPCSPGKDYMLISLAPAYLL